MDGVPQHAPRPTDRLLLMTASGLPMQDGVSTMKFIVAVDKEYCKGCELCIEACEHGVLTLSSQFNSRGQHFATGTNCTACTGCLRCADVCPDAAIEITKDKT